MNRAELDQNNDLQHPLIENCFGLENLTWKWLKIMIGPSVNLDDSN
jgi:hypothetical protein